MKTNFFNVVMISVVFLFGCKKNESSQQTIIQPPNSYIKSISVYDTSGVLRLIQTLTYDSLNRLKKISAMQLGTNPDTILLTYTLNYSELKVCLKETISTSSQYSFKITYYLNSSGLADSSTYVSSGSPNDSTYQKYVYAYNTAGQLTTKGLKSSDSISGTIVYHYSNLNVDYTTAIPSHQNSKFLYFYNLDHFNTIGNENGGMGFLGKSCSSPMIKAKIDGMTVDLATYSYEYDQLNRISRIIVNGNSIIPGVDFFTVPIIMTNQVMVYTYY